MVSSLKGQMLHIHYELIAVTVEPCVTHRDRCIHPPGYYKTYSKRFRRYQILGIIPLKGSQKLKILTRHAGHHLKNVNFKGFNPEKSKQNSVNIDTHTVEICTELCV